MTRVIFGAWDGQLIDNRDKKIFEIPDDPRLDNFIEFNKGNPIKGFFGAYGFFVFENDIHLPYALKKYLERASVESCGKCTPCRVGSSLIVKQLEALTQQSATKQDLAHLLNLAKHIQKTSLCGLGQTFPSPLIALLENFEDEFLKQLAQPNTQQAQPVTTYLTSPCIEACPSHVDVPRYIDYLKDGKLSHSVGVVLQKYPMAATCGRVCVRFCEMACQRTMVDQAVGIKVLKRFVADHEAEELGEWFSPEMITNPKPKDLKVAVIGAGPAGISCAYHLLLNGFPVDIYEGFDKPGGMAYTGIPEYRLPKKILQREAHIIEDLNGRIFYKKQLGKDFTLDDLKKDGYQSVFLGLGAHKGRVLDIPGETRLKKGYEFGVHLLLTINQEISNKNTLTDFGRKMVVIGGGNVAMDCARCGLRLGASEVHLVYRRTKEEMPADPTEVEAAMEEGVQFHFLAQPTRLISQNGKITSIELNRMQLGEKDASGRRSVFYEEDAKYQLDCDLVVPAIGQAVDHSFVGDDSEIEFNKKGLIKVDDNSLMTSRKGVFAGGDCVTGPATVIQAMAQGEQAAHAISDYLTKGRVSFNPEQRFSELVSQVQEMTHKGFSVPIRHEYRVQIHELDPKTRKSKFEEVEKPISLAEAYHEAARCLRCYRVYAVVTEQ